MEVINQQTKSVYSPAIFQQAGNLFFQQNDALEIHSLSEAEFQRLEHRILGGSKMLGFDKLATEVESFNEGITLDEKKEILCQVLNETKELFMKSI